MKDTRLYFLKDPFVFIPLILFFSGLGAIYHREQPKTPQVKKEVITTVKKDTTEWRKQYYEHLYNNK